MPGTAYANFAVTECDLADRWPVPASMPRHPAGFDSFCALAPQVISTRIIDAAEVGKGALPRCRSFSDVRPGP